MDDTPLPRFDSVQRRAFLKRATMLGAFGLIPGLACGTDDAATFAKASGTTSSSAAAATTTTTTTATTEGSSGTALPDGAELTVDFTYAVSDAGGGPARNPYIAVWIESAAGDLVRNISVWFESGRGERWLNELPSWYSADQDYYDAHHALDFRSVSGATRPAGTYSVVWDGRDEAGARATAGDYVVFVESNREHGTHSLTSAPLALGARAVKADLPDEGDLSGVAARYSV